VVVGGALDPDAEATAMMGRNGGPVGAVLVEPEVATLSLGYDVHDMVKALLDRAATTWVDWSAAMVTGPPEAVKGPTLLGAVGKSRARPELGTGDGMGTSKLIDPVETCEGAAP
jgi:hypothetical protein